MTDDIGCHRPPASHRASPSATETSLLSPAFLFSEDGGTSSQALKLRSLKTEATKPPKGILLSRRLVTTTIPRGTNDDVSTHHCAPVDVSSPEAGRPQPCLRLHIVDIARESVEARDSNVDLCSCIGELLAKGWPTFGTVDDWISFIRYSSSCFGPARDIRAKHLLPNLVGGSNAESTEATPDQDLLEFLRGLSSTAREAGAVALKLRDVRLTPLEVLLGLLEVTRTLDASLATATAAARHVFARGDPLGRGPLREDSSASRATAAELSFLRQVLTDNPRGSPVDFAMAGQLRISNLAKALSGVLGVGAERLDAARLDAARLDAARLDAARLDATRLDATRLDAARLDVDLPDDPSCWDTGAQGEPSAARSEKQSAFQEDAAVAPPRYPYESKFSQKIAQTAARDRAALGRLVRDWTGRQRPMTWRPEAVGCLDDASSEQDACRMAVESELPEPRAREPLWREAQPPISSSSTMVSLGMSQVCGLGAAVRRTMWDSCTMAGKSSRKPCRELTTKMALERATRHRSNPRLDPEAVQAIANGSVSKSKGLSVLRRPHLSSLRRDAAAKPLRKAGIRVAPSPRGKSVDNRAEPDESTGESVHCAGESVGSRNESRNESTNESDSVAFLERSPTPNSPRKRWSPHIFQKASGHNFSVTTVLEEARRAAAAESKRSTDFVVSPHPLLAEQMAPKRSRQPLAYKPSDRFEPRREHTGAGVETFELRKGIYPSLPLPPSLQRLRRNTNKTDRQYKLARLWDHYKLRPFWDRYACEEAVLFEKSVVAAGQSCQKALTFQTLMQGQQTKYHPTHPPTRRTDSWGEIMACPPPPPPTLESLESKPLLTRTSSSTAVELVAAPTVCLPPPAKNHHSWKAPCEAPPLRCKTFPRSRTRFHCLAHERAASGGRLCGYTCQIIPQGSSH